MDLDLKEKIPHDEGEVEIRQKSTIALLDEWLNLKLRYQDDNIKKKEISEIISPLKKIRKLRQKPAHSINEDNYDEKYYNMQRDLIEKAYISMRFLRLTFAKHPK